MNLKDKKVLVYDRGLFVHVALRLGRDFGKCYYYLAEEMVDPSKVQDNIGTGFEEIEVVYDFWKYADMVDIIVFTDVNNGGLPIYLKKHGYKVFDALKSEEIETDRILLKKILKAAKLPVAPYVVKKGIDNIEHYLEDKTDKWLKAPHYRLDLETEHYENAFLASTWFDKMRHCLGSATDDFEMIIEDAIESDCEPGFEAPMLNGEIPKWPIVGYENKDKAYAGCVVKELPKYLMDVHKKMQPVFKKFGYQAWYSSEIKVAKDGTPYFLDATCRFGYPPSGTYSELYKNFSECVWDLAHGVMPKPLPLYRYGVEIILHSHFARKHALPLEFPESIAQWVKLKDVKKIAKGQYAIMPHNNEGCIGSVVALDNDLEKAMKTCLERAKLVKGEDVDIDEHVFDKIRESIKIGKKYGIEFTAGGGK